MSVLVGPEGETTCSSPAVANSLSAPGETLRVGDSLNFTCMDGFQLDGAQQITCGADGQWQPLPPRCLPTYVPTRVPDKECEFVFLQFNFFSSLIFSGSVKLWSALQLGAEPHRPAKTPTWLTDTSQ